MEDNKLSFSHAGTKRFAVDYRASHYQGKEQETGIDCSSNKLLKQSFAIAKSGLPYDDMHVSVLKIK